MPPKKRYKQYLFDDNQSVPKSSAWRLNHPAALDPQDANDEIFQQPEQNDCGSSSDSTESMADTHSNAEHDTGSMANSHSNEEHDTESMADTHSNEEHDTESMADTHSNEEHDTESMADTHSNEEHDAESVVDAFEEADEPSNLTENPTINFHRDETRQSQSSCNRPGNTLLGNRPRVHYEEIENHPDMRDVEVVPPENCNDVPENQDEEIITIDEYIEVDDIDQDQQTNAENDEGIQQNEHQQEVDPHQQDNNDGEIQAYPNPPTHTKLRQTLQKEEFMAPILKQVKASPAEALLMTLALSEKNNFTFKAFLDCVKLINSIFTSPVIPNTGYLLDTLLNSSEGIVKYFFCSNSSFSFGNCDSSVNPVLICAECGHSNDIKDLTKASFFVVYQLGPQLELLLLNEDVKKNLSHPKAILEKCIPNSMSDLYHGQCYKKFAASLPEDDLVSKVISLIISADGSPLFKSSNFSIWPFFASINELPPLLRMKHLLLGGLWFGNKKPHMDLFLSPIVEHLRQFEAGFSIKIDDEQVIVRAFTIGCCADSGARGPMQGLNLHSGYFSCNWCEIPGEYIDNKVVFPFPETPPKKRTHESVAEQARECVADDRLAYVFGVQYLSPLATLSKFDIVDGMILDYAHNLPFGVCRTLLGEWLTNVSRGSYIGAPTDMKELDKKMMALTPPIEIRKPVRKVSSYANWSAREYENWTLYYSYPVLTEILPLKYLVNWGLLVQAMFLLNRSCVTNEDKRNAKKLLLHFARDLEHMYGDSFMSYNLHILALHMAENVDRWGPFWAASSLCYEAGIKELKELIHAQRGVWHQIQRSFSYKQASHLLRSKCRSETTEAFEESIVSKPNKKTKYLSTRNCALIGSSSDFTPTEEENFLLENYSEPLDKSQLSMYNKLITGRCVYTTESASSGKKHNNSCATTVNKKLVIVKKIIFDKSSEKTMLLVVDIRAETFLRIPQGIRLAPEDHFLRLVTSVGERLMLLPVSDLKIVNVLTKMNDKTYVGEFPNVFNVC